MVNEGAKGLRLVLEHNRRIQYMDLSGNKISHVAAEILAIGFQTNTGIGILDLSFNPEMKANGIAAILKSLHEHPTLHSLYFIDNNVQNQSAQNIRDLLIHNTKITSLNISSNKIEADGANLIAFGFQKNKALIKLDISSNPIGDNGAISFANAIKKHSSIQRISLKNANIRVDGILGLTAALNTNKSLTHCNLDLAPGNDKEKMKKAQEALINVIEEKPNLIEFRCTLKEVEEHIKKSIADNLQKQFIYILFILINDPNWSFLPNEVTNRIMHFFCLLLSEDLRYKKSHHQLLQCANFFFQNKELPKKQPIKVEEKISKETKQSTFSFSFFSSVKVESTPTQTNQSNIPSCSQ